MCKVIDRKELAENIYRIGIEAPAVARAASAGQFVVLVVDEQGERFPLTLYGWDADNGIITLVVQAVGVSTRKLCSVPPGGSIAHVAGPLGHAVEKKLYGRVICIGGGVGSAEAYPVAKTLKKAGNEVTVLMGARTADLVVCEEDMRYFADKVLVVTDDGSAGEKGIVTDILKKELNSKPVDMVFAVGPALMMRAVAALTLAGDIYTRVSLNTIMMDGTGMCGSCRVIYGGEQRFACVDGPDFNAEYVDFDDLIRRTVRYEDKEKQAMDHRCRIGLDKRSGE
jgi:ferredoxin--NADP+ reductase